MDLIAAPAAARPRTVAEWRVSGRDVVAGMAEAPALAAFPPGLCALIASFVATQHVSATALHDAYRRDPVGGIQVAVAAAAAAATAAAAGGPPAPQTVAPTRVSRRRPARSARPCAVWPRLQPRRTGRTTTRGSHASGAPTNKRHS
jgi:hypothetical protein